MIQIETTSHDPFFNQAFEDYVFRTFREDEALLLIVNRAAHPVHCHAELTCPGAGLCEETRLAFVRSEYDCAVDCFDDTHIVLHDGVGAFDLPPYAAKIYRLENRHGTETGS
mgnify:CR=1 FL=1